MIEEVLRKLLYNSGKFIKPGLTIVHFMSPVWTAFIKKYTKVHTNIVVYELDTRILQIPVLFLTVLP